MWSYIILKLNLSDGNNWSTMAVAGRTTMLDPQSDAIWILSSTFIVFTMQSGKLLIEIIKDNKNNLHHFAKFGPE